MGANEFFVFQRRDSTQLELWLCMLVVDHIKGHWVQIPVVSYEHSFCTLTRVLSVACSGITGLIHGEPLHTVCWPWEYLDCKTKKKQTSRPLTSFIWTLCVWPTPAVKQWNSLHFKKCRELSLPSLVAQNTRAFETHAFWNARLTGNVHQPPALYADARRPTSWWGVIGWGVGGGIHTTGRGLVLFFEKFIHG